MAGVWEYWQSPDGSEILSASILTRDANATMEPIHHRMPLILPESEWAGWLDTGKVKPNEVQPYLRPVPDHILTRHPVDSRVNKASEEGPELIEPVEPPSHPEQMDLFG